MLTKLLIKEATFLHEVKEEVESLAKKFKDIGSDLKKANVMTDREEEFDEWVTQVRDLAFKAEDVIEVFVNNATPYDGYNVLQLIMGCFCQIITLQKLKNEIDYINVKLDNLPDRSSLITIQSPEDEDLILMRTQEDDDMVGFLKEANELATSLRKEEPRGQLVVVSIWAQAGAGKTALARNIYKRRDVNNEFDFVAWVSVSPYYEVKDIWQAILKQVKKLTEEEKDELQTKKEVEMQSMIPEGILTEEMKDVAKQMLAKCEGLPIAIVLLGGILSAKKKDIFEWIDMLEKVHSDLTESRVLRKEQRSDDNEITMEDVGRECLKGLIQRSMIQVVEYKSNGAPQTCRTHDLVGSLAIQEAKKAKFSTISKKKQLGGSVVEGSRRIALHPPEEEFFHIAEADQLASRLTGEEPLGRLAAISIVGMGGIDAESKLEDEEELQRMLCYHLKEKSYLIVLDNTWRQEDWDVIERVLPKPLNGEKCGVLITTRIPGHSVSGSGDSQLQLRVLSEKESLNLFLQTTFKCSKDEIPAAGLTKEIMHIASEFLKLCCGCKIFN
ncbi:disease resistance protein RPP13-like [Macadamia integrifolia]|uniref:disease resistance protein RPP13-like n=1 Tax=Macadamia integrifolia TaxID=60698 RepID=UPI001C4ED0B2|nr:disease resistance protein RPP13-like [Macadamia integrifolia]